MIPNNNLNPLPWYTDIADQNHRKEWAYGKVYPLICQSRLLLPFQVVRDHAADTPITSFKLIELETGTEYDITTAIQESNLIIKEFTTYDLIINYGRFLLPSEFSFKGLFYCQMTDGTNIWFSEVFNFIQDVSEYIKVVWYNRNDIFEYSYGHIDYNDGYQNYIYIASEIGKPDYPFEEDVIERDGYTFPEKQWSEKVFRFDFIAPEYMLDAMRIIRMHDYIWIQQKGKLWDVEQFIIDPEWEEQGDLAIVEAEFHVDSVMKKIGKGLAALENGDFNDDFNNDFSGGEGGEDTPHEFYFMTESTEIGVGLFVKGCHVLVKVKATSEVIWDETVSSYKFYKPNFGAGITYEITITRDGYITKVFDFIAGNPPSSYTQYVLLEPDGANVYYTKQIGGADLSTYEILYNVAIQGTPEYRSIPTINENSGSSGLATIQGKKGVIYNMVSSKTGYQNGSYVMTETSITPLYIGMNPI